jgi:hypothetical protein
MRTSKLYQKMYGICIEYIPDGHAYITFLGQTTKGRYLIGFSDECYFAEVEQFSLGKIILSTYVNANTSLLRNPSF